LAAPLPVLDLADVGSIADLILGETGFGAWRS
jgi:hypothetical protein